MKKTFIFIAIIAFCGCKTKSNKEVFNKYFDKNVKICIKTAMQQANIDEVTAARRCSCVITTMYTIDSTIINMNDKELELFTNKNIMILNNACADSELMPQE